MFPAHFNEGEKSMKAFNLIIIYILGVICGATTLYFTHAPANDTPVKPKYSEGDCLASDNKIFKVVEVGQYSYKLIDTDGNYHTSSISLKAFDLDTNHVDCFDRFGLKINL
jgi:hypothetical protein